MLSRALRKRGGPSSCRERRPLQGPTLSTIQMLGPGYIFFCISKKHNKKLYLETEEWVLMFHKCMWFPKKFTLTSVYNVYGSAEKGQKNWNTLSRYISGGKLPVIVKGVWHRAHSWATLMPLQGFSACSEARSRAEWKESSGWAVQNSAVTQFNTTQAIKLSRKTLWRECKENCRFWPLFYIKNRIASMHHHSVHTRNASIRYWVHGLTRKSDHIQLLATGCECCVSI